MLKLLNLGCGSRFCSDPCWTNIDFNSSNNQVISYNLLHGIPFPDGTFDAVYHSHLLEHFTKDGGVQFITECLRVLKPEGLLRVVVPDLEQISRVYLDVLEKVETGDLGSRGKYDWIKLEMYDQAVRAVTGGEMAKYLRQPNLPDKEFIISRIGSVGRSLIEWAGLPTMNKRKKAVDLYGDLETLVGKIGRVSGKLRRLIISMVLNDHDREALTLGLFRLSGEVHQWMYDKYSLRVLLQETGFTEVRQCSAAESKIQHWNGYFLDIDPHGLEHAPSSLYMEGVKPK